MSVPRINLHPRRCHSAFAAAQGAAWSTYWFAADETSQIASSARVGEITASHELGSCAERSPRSATFSPFSELSLSARRTPPAPSPASALRTGPSVSQDRRFPRFFARSALYRSIIAAWSKSPSHARTRDRAEELVAEHVGSAVRREPPSRAGAGSPRCAARCIISPDLWIVREAVGVDLRREVVLPHPGREQRNAGQ